MKINKAIQHLPHSTPMHMQSLLVVLLLLFSYSVRAQKPIPPSSNTGNKKVVKLIHADNILFDKKKVDAQRLIGNVSLEYQGTLFYCDSAYLFANQNFDAFGKIRVQHGADYNVTGDVLFFDKGKNTAKINNNVVLRDRAMTLTSDNINYNLDSEIASYFGGGKIVSNKNNNVLTSREGFYNSNTETFNFRNKVVLTNPEYVVKSDTLQYNNATEIAYFFGPTTITSTDTKIYCENGWYNTRKDICQFNKNASVTSKKTVLKGDSVYYNGVQGYGEVFRNVSIRDTTENYTIFGGYGRHVEKTKQSFVTEKALMIQDFDGDTLHLAADTLRSFPDSLDLNTILAYHQVRIFKKDLQAIADSLVYSEADSTIHLFEMPVLWNEENQITGDSIRIRTWEGHIDQLIVRGNSFIISQAADSLSSDTLIHYNQIKGRNTTGYFVENELTRILIEGNGQLIYFPTDDKPGKTKAIGHNKGDCSNIEIEVRDNKIQRIKLLREPNSVFTPKKIMNPAEFQLENFKWLGHLRPRSVDDLFPSEMD